VNGFSFLLIAAFVIGVIGIIIGACRKSNEASTATTAPVKDSVETDDFDPFGFHLYGADRTAMHFKKSGFLDCLN
jgi:hypothetical protein